jgi:glycosyltransferase involved in cell wall biosynthesis
MFQNKPTSVDGVNLIYLPAIERKTLTQLSHSLMSTLHACLTKTDVLLYVNSANGPFGLLNKLAGKRNVINVDGLEWLRPKWKGLGAKYFWFASYLSARLFNVVIADCERMSEIYRNEFGATPVTIAYGANPGFSIDPKAIGALGLTPGDYYLVVARLVPDNNANVIVRGFEQCQSQRKLVVLGDVPYKDSYANGVRSTLDKRVLFPGYVKDQNTLRELYCNSFAYIHGHEFGGTNPSLLQGLANGCCVLALDTPFNREVLDGESYGLYFDKRRDSLSALIARIEADPELVARLRFSSRRRIEQNYSWEHITDQYEDVIRSLL